MPHQNRKPDVSKDDHQNMLTVVGYIARHSKQRPSGDVTDTRWRYLLMN